MMLAACRRHGRALLSRFPSSKKIRFVGIKDCECQGKRNTKISLNTSPDRNA
jgi:hypothetical protein